MAPIDVLFAILGVLVVAVIGIVGIIFGFKWFDRLTKRIKEVEEIGKGNVAAAIFLAGVILSIAIVMYPGAASMNEEINDISAEENGSWGDYGDAILYGVIDMLIGIIVLVPTLYVLIKVEDWATKTIDEYKELEKGNVAVAIMLFCVMVGIAIIISPSLHNMAELINYKLF